MVVYDFSTTIAKNLPNTGDAWIRISATTQKTSEGRFKLKCSDSIFFALSYRNFVITDKTTQVTFKHSDEDQPEENLKDADLNVVATNTSSSNAANNTSQSSGGGLFNGWLLLISCVLLMRRSIKNE